MYPLGILFGLGFDTSSEIALLGISSIQAAKGTSLWLILIYPCLFTAGMCFLDTVDGALMMALYTSYNTGDARTRDPVRVLYYNIVLTGVTVVVAVVIGVLQTLGLAESVLGDRTQGPFWDGVTGVGARYDVVGGAVCGLFVVVGVASYLLYIPWKNRVDRMMDNTMRSMDNQVTSLGGYSSTGFRLGITDTPDGNEHFEALENRGKIELSKIEVVPTLADVEDDKCQVSVVGNYKG